MRLKLLFGFVGSALLMVGVAHSQTAGVAGTATTRGSDTAQVRLDKEVLSDFKRRVDSYMELHDKLDRKGTPQKGRTDVGENIVSKQALATRIRLARQDSQQGDIFTPAIAAVLRTAMNPRLRGPAAAEARKSIRDDAPKTFVLQVNGDYPEGASRSTMPSQVLEILPPLPKGLEYRIVDNHLILMDLDANIVVDYMLDVM